jgi:hypothetical protein
MCTSTNQFISSWQFGDDGADAALLYEKRDHAKSCPSVQYDFWVTDAVGHFPNLWPWSHDHGIPSDVRLCRGCKQAEQILTVGSNNERERFNGNCCAKKRFNSYKERLYKNLPSLSGDIVETHRHHCHYC